jgi:hypothetical protein
VGVEQRINDLLERLLGLENRVDPWIRPLVGPVLRGPVMSAVQAVVKARRQDAGLGLAEERILPGEDEAVASIIESMSTFTRRAYGDHPPALRAGNTKTYGAVRATFEVDPGLPDHLKRGVLAECRSYPAWVRFASGAPLTPPDVDGIGIMSMAVKLMDVPGMKLLDDEQHTQDFTGLTTPTFATPHVVDNAQLQKHNLEGRGLFYFLGPRHPHLLDGLMQLAYAKTQANPLQEPYYSCTPYLLGEGQAVQFLLKPQNVASRRPPKHFTPDYLQAAMVDTLQSQQVVFEVLVQVQTDAHAMPIEDATVIWPLRLSPRVRVARIVIPRQSFDSPAQMLFAERLSYNPWHSLEDHRPLGNQNRARRTMYRELSRLRHEMNGWPPLEPTGREEFD